MPPLRNNFDPSPYNQHFASQMQHIKAGPIPNSQRKCNDIVCVILFALLMLATLIIGAIMINDGQQFYKTIFKPNSSSTNFTALANVFSTQGGIIVGMFFLALLLAVVYVFLVKMFPQCVVYTLIVLFVGTFVVLIVIGIVNGVWWMVVTFAITLLLTLIMLYCYRREIKTGIMLLKVAASFLTEKPSVYAAPLYALFFAIVFFIYWIAAILGQLYVLNVKYELSKTNSNVSTSKQTGFIAFWVILFIFMIEFFLYVQTYIIATCCSYWYYGINENYCKGTYTMNRYHLGSMTFGAMVITILTILRRMAQSQMNQQMNQGNYCACVCMCLVTCCLRCIQDLVNTLNYNSVIVMSVTGQSYCQSARTAMSIIFQNFGLFYIVDLISSLVTFFGLLVTIGIPTMTGFLIIRYGRQADATQASYAAVAIFFLSIIIAGLIVSMLSDALSCVFIFFCFDRKFRDNGIIVPNAPGAVKQFLEYGDMGNGGRYAAGTQQELRDRKM